MAVLAPEYRANWRPGHQKVRMWLEAEEIEMRRGGDYA
jgi:hypothetical protein